ncbi:unnamed protein product [Owenia fusiformis]|uniref:Uncharacterized protein n=1 Tax=Owenia fusiformis TaxID=6347 RepID=A0A8J1TMK9_OWEFU|nr:unnamed protein product [Owenia fusiformis]
MSTSLLTELYIEQVEKHWPKSGKHILAQYTENSVVVYQAFNQAIADYAIENQRFGGPAFSYDRMSWVKPNFLWMTYRCGWASKKQQERVLAVTITKEGFEEILQNAYTVHRERKEGKTKKDINIRLQWDPDHAPDYTKQERKAIQLGLKNDVLKKYGNEWILKIEDITDFVKEQYRVLQNDGIEHLMVPRERVYHPSTQDICEKIELDTALSDTL